jgi:alkylation response protein AidB-like acyl-CoA dehydrogenase
MTGEPCIDTRIVHLPPPAVFSVVMASVALGIAQGSLDDITVLASTKMPLLSPTALAGNPLFQFELATADTEVRAARSLLHEEAARLWAAAGSGDPLTMEHRAQVRSSAVWTVERATSVVTAAYRAGGGTSLYSDCPLQRRLRDVLALAQHFIVRRDTLVTAGAILAGQDVQPMVF